MNVQTFLREASADAPSELLEQAFDIKVVRHPELPLAVLNYDQIRSPSKHPIVRECRQLVVETQAPFAVVGRSFYRFFNLNEEPSETQELIECKTAVYQTKHDGSIMMLFHYAGAWRVVTRGSFAASPICAGAVSWQDMFFSLLPRLPEDTTLGYVFELCTRYNLVVRPYPSDRLYLLAVMENDTEREWDDAALDALSRTLGVLRPETFAIRAPEEALTVIEDEAKCTYGFEGLVAKFYSDARQRYVRVKIKSAAYLALHHAATGSNPNTWANMLPLLIKGEEAEFLSHPVFQRWAEDLQTKKQRWDQLKHEVTACWNRYRTQPTAKDLALVMKQDRCAFQSLFFGPYRNGQTELGDNFWAAHVKWFVTYLEQESKANDGAKVFFMNGKRPSSCFVSNNTH